MKVKSKVLLLDILARLEKNESLFEIRKWYGWKKQRLNYYISKLKKAEIIQLKTRDRIAFYQLTEKGKTFYIRHNLFLSSGIRLHNIEFIADIENFENYTQDKEWKLRGTINRLKRETNCTIIYNHRSIRFLLSNLFGNNSYELYDEAKSTIEKIISNLELDYGLKISNLRMNRVPHYAIKTPIAEQISQNLELTTEEGKIDGSEGFGEFDWFTPEGADNFMRMPNRLAQLESHLIKQTEIMDQFAKQLELHLSVLTEMKDTLKLIKEKMS